MYRKFTADYLFDGYKILPPGTVLITGSEGKIEAVSNIAEVGDNVQYIPGLLTPGFINTHCHLELSHMLGHIPEKTGLTEFLLKVIFERGFKEEMILEAIDAAETAMLQNGIVAVGDICNTSHTLYQKKAGRLLYHNFIETAGFVSAGAETRFNASKQVFADFIKTFPTSSIAPHAPYSVSPALFSLINQFPGNQILTIHNQEDEAENELYKKGQGDFIGMYQKMNIDISDFKPTGKTSLQSWLPNLTNYQSLILVHDVSTSEADIKFEQQHTAGLAVGHANPSVHYCLCPNANLYITGNLPNVNMLLQNDCSIVLGTDSLASNHQLSNLEEMKTLQQHFPSISLTTLLQWATINGAKALHMDGILGSFENGKQPGLVQVLHTDGHSLSATATSKRIL